MKRSSMMALKIQTARTIFGNPSQETTALTEVSMIALTPAA
jgi:hypothetical protein